MVFENDHLSNLLGLAVICIWVFALFPQVVLNAKRKDASGLSPILLGFWLIGDVCGFAGTALTHQLLFQKLNCFYHLLIDAVLFIQWFTFVRRKRNAPTLREAIYQDVKSYGSIAEYEAAGGDPFTDSAFSRVYSTTEQPAPVGKRRVSTRQLVAYAAALLVVTPSLCWLYYLLGFAHTSFNSPERLVIYGKGLAWFCAALYITSRVPQFIHNYQRKSCIGLSATSFFLASLANLAYVLSILLSHRSHTADGHWNSEHLWKSAPYLATSAGSFACDLVIIAQWRWYIYKARAAKVQSPGSTVRVSFDGSGSATV